MKLQINTLNTATKYFFLKIAYLVKHNECFDKVLSLQKFHSRSIIQTNEKT